MPEITPLNEADALEAARLKYEAEKMTRRAALRKLGITSGMAFFSLFAVDDLARVAIQKMRQNEATRDIAETVAQEFRNAGVAFAGGGIKPGCAGGDIGYNCLCYPVPGQSTTKCLQRACLRCHPKGHSLNPIDYKEFAAYNKCVRQAREVVLSPVSPCLASPDGLPNGG